MRPAIPLLGGLLALASPLLAEDQPEVWRDMDVPPAPVVPAEEAVDNFKVAPGFRVELVAAEPLVDDPVAIDWDADGRLWVVEMRGFMPTVDGKGERAGFGQVVVLEDHDGDGRMDASTVYLDGLVMPRAVAVVEGGVLVAEPPKLLYCRDTDGDLRADEKEVVLDGYGKQGPVEHTDNGLMRALDNWMYNAKSSLRLRFDDGEVLTDKTPFRGQWGVTQDNYGRIYTNSNSSYLHADLFPGDYLQRNPRLSTRHGVNTRIVRDQSVHTIRVNPGINRGYRDGMLRDDGRLARTTAVCGPGIYRGDRFPASFVGDAFVPEPSGNVVSAFDLRNDGVAIRAEHRLYKDEQWGKREFLASTDERFRPVHCETGPDGAMYVVDLYRGILQHKIYVTKFLKKQILERNLDKPLGLGRIYRIVHEDTEPGTTRPDLSAASDGALVKHLDHPNGWWRDTAQRLLVQRDATSAAGKVAEMARDGDRPLGRIHALWTLRGLGAMDAATAVAAMGASHPKVREAAVRTAEPLLASEKKGRVLDAIASRVTDEAPGVRLQVMLTLGEARGTDRAEAAMADLLTAHAESRYLRQAAVSGLKNRELAMARRLLAREEWEAKQSGYPAVLERLSDAAFRSREPKRVAALLSLAAEQPVGWRQIAILAGMRNAGNETGAVKLDRKPAAWAKLAKVEKKAVRKRLKQVRKVVQWPDAD